MKQAPEPAVSMPVRRESAPQRRARAPGAGACEL